MKISIGFLNNKPVNIKSTCEAVEITTRVLLGYILNEENSDCAVAGNVPKYLSRCLVILNVAIWSQSIHTFVRWKGSWSSVASSRSYAHYVRCCVGIRAHAPALGERQGERAPRSARATKSAVCRPPDPPTPRPTRHSTNHHILWKAYVWITRHCHSPVAHS